MGMHKELIEHVLYPAMEALKGNHVRAIVQEMTQTAKLGEAELAALQKERLMAVLLNAVQNAPAYQGLDVPQEAIESDPFAALRRIPPLSKQSFRDHADDYLTEPKDTLIPNRTGGSTGDPVRFYMDRAQVETYEAARWRGLSWYGITQGSRSLMIWGSPIELEAAAQKKEARRERLLKNRKVVSAYNLTPDTVRALVLEADRYKPEYLYGYAGALHTVALLMEQNNLHFKVPLKAAVSTSETLTDDMAARMRRVFGCPVANEYGARDAGILAYACPQGHMHIVAENAVIEILDPITLEPVPDGTSGLIAVTDLHNFCMPRLRYLLGDAGTLSGTPCACGIKLPVFSSIDGREDAILVAAGGRLVHGNAIRQLIKAYDGVASFQIEQTAKESAILRAQLLTGFTQMQPELLEKIHETLPGVSIDVQYVDSIPLEKSGKYRCAVRRFPLQ